MREVVNIFFKKAISFCCEYVEVAGCLLKGCSTQILVSLWAKLLQVADVSGRRHGTVPGSSVQGSPTMLLKNANSVLGKTRPAAVT